MTDKCEKTGLLRICNLVAFGVAFAYIESAVVVYLRAIFYPDGFTFPFPDFAKFSDAKFYLLTEIGREAATIVLIFTSSYLMVKKLRHRIAYFLIIFAVWDIFYYVWLKVLLDWPASILDWDILFFIPSVWAGPVLAPVLTSILMICIGIRLLGAKPVKIEKIRWILIAASIIMITISFCIPGPHISDVDYSKYFSWPFFVLPHILIIGCIFFTKSKEK